MKCVQFWDVSLTWPVFTPTPTHQILSAPWGHPWAVNTGLKFFSLSFFCILLTLKCYHISFDAQVISNILTKAQMQYMYPVWDLKKIPLQIKFHSCRGFGKWVSKPVFGISYTEKRSRMSKSTHSNESFRASCHQHPGLEVLFNANHVQTLTGQVMQSCYSTKLYHTQP